MDRRYVGIIPIVVSPTTFFGTPVSASRCDIAHFFREDLENPDFSSCLKSVKVHGLRPWYVRTYVDGSRDVMGT
jgi:hypothetical protein